MLLSPIDDLGVQVGAYYYCRGIIMVNDQNRMVAYQTVGPFVTSGVPGSGKRGINRDLHYASILLGRSIF